MSKRSKFVFCTWVGPNVSVMKKAKMSTDKALMKELVVVRILRKYIISIFNRCEIFRTCPWSFRSRTLMNLPWTTSKLRWTKPGEQGGEI